MLSDERLAEIKASMESLSIIAPDTAQDIGCLLDDLQTAASVNRRLRDEVERLKAAIRRVLDDDESRPGAWGPDVTGVLILQEALAGKVFA